MNGTPLNGTISRRLRQGALAALLAGVGLAGLGCTGSVLDAPGFGPGGTTDGTGAGAPGGGSTGTGAGTGSTGSGSGSAGAGTGSGSGTGTAPPPPPPPPAGAPVTGPLASVPGPSSRFVRLSHRQWENTVRDLLRLATPSGLSKEFLSEPIRSSFDNNGAVLQVSSNLWLDYQRAAENLGAQMGKTSTMWTPFLAGSPATVANARKFIEGFGLRAYRRPLTSAELDKLVALFNQGPTLVGSGNAFADGVDLVVSAFLQSPHFLYRTELGGTVVNGRVALNDYEVATRLSYGLINSMPDEQLLAAAGKGEVHTRDSVLVHAKRLLESEAGKATVEDFHTQMLHLSGYEEIRKDAAVNPLFLSGMGADMKQETLTFLRETVFTEGKGVAELLSSPVSYVNSRLAAVYGLPARSTTGGDPFVRTELDPTQRAGLYTQLGFLAQNATDRSPRSIMRGVHVSLDALCVELPAPPDVPPQTPSDVGKTNRQLLEAFTESPGSICQSCHGSLINPLGFAFEGYDGIGKHRTTDNGQAVDASGTYAFADGTRSFKNAPELMKAVSESRQAHDCYAQHLFEYLYGRERVKELGGDSALVTEVGRRSQGKQPVKALILDLVSTEAFLTRLP